MSLLICLNCGGMAFTKSTAFAIDGPPVVDIERDRRPVVECVNCQRLFIVEQDGLVVVQRGALEQRP